MKVLAVDDDPAILRLLTRHLNDAGYDVLTATNGHEALRVLADEGPQLLITDWMMPGMDGLALCSAIRNSETAGFVYIIFLTSNAQSDDVVQALTGGADDFLAKPFNKRELIARLSAGRRIIDLEADLARNNLLLHKANAELAVLNDQLDRLATTDELTGLVNRREGLRRLHEAWLSAARHGTSLSCLMIDIDHFKRVNDSHGHAFGDQVLKHTADILLGSTRAGEPACRIGGEEFLVICPSTNIVQAQDAAERLRVAVGQTPLRIDDIELMITISVGVACAESTSRTIGDLLKLADQALYAAKAAGRNCVRASEDAAAHARSA